MNRFEDKLYSRGVRGTITLKENSKDEIKSATVELLSKMLEENNIKTEDISFAIFTLTNDLNAEFPAKYAREYLDFKYVPMMCYHELNVPGSLAMCLRILLNINTSKEQKEIKHIYLKDAKNLRQDIKND